MKKHDLFGLAVGLATAGCGGIVVDVPLGERADGGAISTTTTAPIVGDTRCQANVPQTFAQEGWVSGSPCEGSTPSCSGGACFSSPPPSCVGLAENCGGNQNCCSSNLVPGGTFKRSYDGVTEDYFEADSELVNYKDPSFVATVSDFDSTTSKPRSADSASS